VKFHETLFLEMRSK